MYSQVIICVIRYNSWNKKNKNPPGVPEGSSIWMG